MLTGHIGLLAAVWQADTGFPSGGFAFSNGVEGIAALGEPLDRRGFAAVVDMHLRHRWRTADRVAVARAVRVGDDFNRLRAIDEAIEAATLAEPLRAGSRRQGAALVAAHARIATPGAAALQGEIRAGRLLGHLPVVQGALWRSLGLDEAAAVTVSAYTTMQGLATAAVRLGRIGVVAAQAVVAAAFPAIAEIAGEPVDDDQPIASFATLLDVAASRHAGADTRLFAN